MSRTSWRVRLAYSLPVDQKALLSGAGIAASTTRPETHPIRSRSAVLQNLGEPCTLCRIALDEYLVLTGAIGGYDR